MRFRRLKIENFRGIRTLSLDDLKDVVVIAGPNGCGKTAALDAIRLLKSFYGGYQENEWQQWMGEFQINAGNPEDVRKLFGDPAKQLLIQAEIELSAEEIQFLRTNAEDILTPLAWSRILGHRYSGSFVSSNEIRQYGEQVAIAVRAHSHELRQATGGNVFQAGLSIPPSGQLSVEKSIPLEVVFQTYAPQKLGVIDYHSSSRTYERESLGGVNLNLDAMTEQRRGQLLYNWRDKYRNVKTELASHYVRDIIAQKGGGSPPGDLNATLSELFQTFFPDKHYEGIVPQPTGSLLFPVRLATGQKHDIDDLSSGEKEILYGYLRLRNSAPRNSTILIDEPELHLNPRLLQGFVDFYDTHLGRALNNQLWLVTHSDTLLRQAVGKPGITVFHMSPLSTIAPQENQASQVIASDDVERAIVSIVGDLAAYRPRAKIVLFEGGGDSDVDVTIVSRLFRVYAQTLNFVGGGHKRRVRDLYAVLSDTASKAGLSERFYAVVDRDRENPELPGLTNVMKWDRYHIENYLLDESALKAALMAALGGSPFADEEGLVSALRGCANSLIDKLVLERLQSEINDGIIRAIRIGASPKSVRPAVDLMPSIVSSLARVNEVGQKYASDGWLADKEQEHRRALQGALASDEWRAEFPGRSLLSLFVERHVPGASYEVFRNIVLDKMVEAGTEPVGIKRVLEAISAAQ